MDYNHGMASQLTQQNIPKLLAKLPGRVEVMAAVKTTTPEEVMEVVQVGIKILGEDYVNKSKEASTILVVISLPVKIFNHT